MRFRRFLAVSAVIALPLLAACTPRVTTTGTLPRDEDLAQISVGETEMREVAELLGSPAVVPAFDRSVWLYISRKTEALAFFEPEVVEQNVVLIRFDEQQRTIAIARYGVGEGREIVPVGRTTPTAGKDLTILQQIFGNLGRFSGDQ